MQENYDFAVDWYNIIKHMIMNELEPSKVQFIEVEGFWSERHILKISMFHEQSYPFTLLTNRPGHHLSDFLSISTAHCARGVRLSS